MLKRKSRRIKAALECHVYIKDDTNIFKYSMILFKVTLNTINLNYHI